MKSSQQQEEEDDEDESYEDNAEGEEEENDDDLDADDDVEAEVEGSSSSDEDDDDPGAVMDSVDRSQNDSSGGIQYSAPRTSERISEVTNTMNSRAINEVGGEMIQQSGSPLVAGNGGVSSPALHLDGFMHIRGMSKSESMRNRQKHVALRVRTYVKSIIFRKIKFINSDMMFQKAMTLVMDHEAVPHHLRGKFQMLYESVFNESLNTKRSSCEQTGGKIVRDRIVHFKEKGNDFLP